VNQKYQLQDGDMVTRPLYRPVVVYVMSIGTSVDDLKWPLDVILTVLGPAFVQPQNTWQ